MTALELWSEQYQSGDASAEDVVGQAHDGREDHARRRPDRLLAARRPSAS